MLAQPSTPMQKLLILVNQIISLKSRSELAQRKQQLKLFLQEYSATNYGLGLFEEFLGYAMKQKKIEYMLMGLEESVHFGVYFEKVCEEVLRKYLLSNNEKQIFDDECGRPVRLFLARMMLQFSNTMQCILNLCRNDQIICMKVLQMIVEYYQGRKIVGNVTGLMILCINLLKIKQKDQVASPLLKNSLKILNIVAQNMQSIRAPLLSSLQQQISELLTSGQVITESIHFMSNYIKYSNVESQVVSAMEVESSLFNIWIENVCAYLKQVSKVQSSKVTVRRDLVNRDESSWIGEFFVNSHAYLKINKQEHMMKLIMDTCISVIFILDPQINGKLFTDLCLFDSSTSLQLVFFRQCLANCSNYYFKHNKYVDKQNEIIDVVLSWWEKLDDQFRSQVKKELDVEEYPKNSSAYRNENEHPETIFLEFIKKTIENQFQFEFDKNIVNSVCNLFCYLSPTLTGKQNCKQTVIELIKMLLNLNESCEKQYRQLMVCNIIKILCVYSRLLLKDNQFLHEVFENKVLQNFYKNKQEILYLVNEKMLSSKFYERVMQKILISQVNEICSDDIQFLFQVLLSNDRDVFKKNAIGWEWDAYVATVGIKIYGKEWIIDEKELKETKNDRMANYSFEFEDDIQRIQSILASGEQKSTKK